MTDKKQQTNKQQRLGRGLSALLGPVPPDSSVVAPSSPSRIKEEEFNKIKISLIDANPWQPRTDFEVEALQELSDSIKANGLIQPITVRHIDGGRYQLIAGERRLRASKMAGMETIAAYVRNATDMQLLEMGLIENIQREDLNPIEIALSFQRLIDECNLKQEELATKVAKSRSQITNYLRLLKLSTPVQKAVCDGTISMGHAKMLVTIEDIDRQNELTQLIIAQDLSVRQVEELVKKDNKVNPLTPKSITKVKLPERFTHVSKSLATFYDAKIVIKRDAKGKGSIAFAFKSDKDLERLLKLLNK